MINKIKELWNKYKRLLLYILIPLITGFLGNMIAGNTEIYNKIKTPSFAPPGFLFPIVWSVLYILMGISAYIISSLWPLFFFRFTLFAVATLWLVLLIVLVSFMIYEFYKLNKTAGLLNIPYLLWISFAFILNYSIYLLN